MNKGNEQVGLLAAIMIEKGITSVVVSPGSRNAPAIINFAGQKEFSLVSIADERSAGFFALGMALKTHKPVALLCTSGTAVLNYAPAIAEALYQKVPLLVITADRPKEFIDQADGQTIRQENIYANYIRKSFNLPAVIETPESKWYATRIINEAIDRCLFPAAGPVHLNMPLSEPLYNPEINSHVADVRIITMAGVEKKLSGSTINQLARQWNGAESKLVLVGQLPTGIQVHEQLARLANDPSVSIMTEATSNLHHPAFNGCIDRVIDGMNEAEIRQIKPEILLTMGSAVVSKKIKALLRRMQPALHWHVCEDPDEFHTDTYQSLTLTIPLSPEIFTSQLADAMIPTESIYSRLWADRILARKKQHDLYIPQLEFCDMQVYDLLFRNIPANTDIHLANSTPVRYAQLFDQKAGHFFYANRGTSGIDGCVSTAAGAAYAGDRPVTVITGDIGFFYDSNALWNSALKPDFRIILINNGGGNIFRIIDGPSNFPQLEPYIETNHHRTAEGIARNFGIDYYQATDKTSLNDQLIPFFDYAAGKTALLEIITPNILSANMLKEYFKYLNS